MLKLSLYCLFLIFPVNVDRLTYFTCCAVILSPKYSVHGFYVSKYKLSEFQIMAIAIICHLFSRVQCFLAI